MLEYIVEKLKYKNFLGHAAVDQNQIRNKPSQIIPHEVLQSLLINTVYNLLGKNN